MKLMLALSASKQLHKQSGNEGLVRRTVNETQSIAQKPIMDDLLDETKGVGGGDELVQVGIKSTALDVAESRAKLQLLRRRQKKLKHENEIANLRNMIQRQQDLLGQVSRELTDNSTQLQTCVDTIKSKQESLDSSAKRLNEMKHRKKIIEGMVLRSTEQVIAARKALSDRRLLVH